jgi:predicted DNA-binding WGR domain protein
MPVQLALFPEAVALTRLRPEPDECRFYRLEIWPDLFGRTMLVRQWGRIGTPGRRRLDPHPDAGAALNALAQLARAKRRHGYCDTAAVSQ